VYAEDGTLQYANVPPVQGLDNLTSFFGPIFKKLELMRHEILYYGKSLLIYSSLSMKQVLTVNCSDLVEDKMYQACTITYRAKNDPNNEEIVVPAFGVFHILPSGKDAGKMKRAEVYLDPAPLMAAIARVE
jgi:hypothetical protein